MNIVKGYKPGAFCWVELATSDSDAAKNFYTQLFDWSFADHPVDENMVYTMLRIGEQDVAALYGMTGSHAIFIACRYSRTLDTISLPCASPGARIINRQAIKIACDPVVLKGCSPNIVSSNFVVV